MIEQIELAVVIALLIRIALKKDYYVPEKPEPMEPQMMARFLGTPTPLQESAHVHNEDCIQILKGNLKYCERPSGHPDLKEFLDTPGFYLKHPDGTIEEGIQ